MAYTLLGAPKPQFLDDDGAPASGSLLYIYTAGTDTLTTTYSDSAGAVPNTNPVVMDAAGRPNAIYIPTGSYKFVLTDADGLQLWSQDNVTFLNPA